MDSTGNDAEEACCNHLERSGLRLIERNYRCRYGEIDLIMLDGSTVVFIEVRYRSTDGYGGPLVSITRSKQRKVRASAETWLQSNGRGRDARIDVVGMRPSVTGGTDYRYEWIRAAF